MYSKPLKQASVYPALCHKKPSKNTAKKHSQNAVKNIILMGVYHLIKWGNNMAKKSKMKRKSGNGKPSQKMVAKKLPSIKDPLSKSNMIKAITDVTCISKRDVVAVLDCLTQVIEKHVKSGGPGIFTMPGLLKISVVKKPARAARKGVNPFTGEEIMIKAKPAYKTVKVKALKKLKAMVD